MIRTTGIKSEYKPIDVVSESDNIYLVRWDYAAEYFENPETGEHIDSNLATWAEELFYFKPTETELRRLFSKYYNDITDNKILSGFVWNGMSVWLSTENQMNYKAAYDIAVQTNGANLPIEFKFGPDNAPVYHVFNTVEELQSFYLPAVKYVQQCLTEGWRQKDAINYSQYEV